MPPYAEVMDAPPAVDTRARRAVEAVWRAESARIVSALTRHTGDFTWAEDLAQEALVEALARWPQTGIPDTPGAWLLSVAKRRAIDGWRRRERLQAREAVMAHDLREEEARHPVEADGDPDRIDDDVLRLVFVACHPVLPAQARLALTLRTVAGLTTDEIARVLLSTVPTVQQRIVRAKRSLAEAGVPFEVPDRSERPARLASVLQVLYLLFTEGYASATGDAAIRPDVAREAVRLGRVLAALMPTEPEIFSLIALMEFQSSRFGTRIGADGLPVPLAEQHRGAWDRSAIGRGRDALAHAESFGRGLGYYGLQAAVAECHVVARRSTTRTGRSSFASTTPSKGWRRPPSSASTVPSPSRWRPARARRCASSRILSPMGRWMTSGPCMRCARNCSSGWASRRPRPRLSAMPPSCRGTRPKGALCAPAPMLSIERERRGSTPDRTRSHRSR